MVRVPNTGPAELERLALIKRMEKKLAYYQKIPPRRREAECADEGEALCRGLLTELGAPGHMKGRRPMFNEEQ